MRATMGVQAQLPLRAFAQNTGDVVKCSNGEYEELNKNLRAIKEENLKLKAVINDVTEVNKRWQKYNNDRQIYVQRLLTTIQDQQEQINKMGTSRAFSTPATPSVEGVEASSLQDAIARLQRQIERLDLEHGETVQVLKFQVKAHHDDWEAERREKQQALQDKLTAEAKIRQLHKELRAHKLKLREERLETENRCSCCCSHTCEAEHDLPTSRLNYCRNENTKTYRTSVHVPCNAGHLLSRGTTLSFDDDLAMDGDINKTELHTATTSRSNSDNCLENNPTNSTDKIDESKEESGSDPTSNGAVESSASTPALGRSVLHVPSSDAPNAVRIGFNDDGLASVLSFPQTPIVKSLSLPNPTESGGRGPSSGSARSGPPSETFTVSAESLLHRPNKLSLLGAFAKSVKRTRASDERGRKGEDVGAVAGRELSWKPKYFEEGVDTQTREDIICPVCDLLFPPTSHVKFLDHFGKCQNNTIEQKLKRV